MNKSVMDQAAKANGLAILLGLNNTGKHIYGGTASHKKVAARRAKNRVARKSRSRC